MQQHKPESFATIEYSDPSVKTLLIRILEQYPEYVINYRTSQTQPMYLGVREVSFLEVSDTDDNLVMKVKESIQQNPFRRHIAISAGTTYTLSDLSEMGFDKFLGLPLKSCDIYQAIHEVLDIPKKVKIIYTGSHTVMHIIDQGGMVSTFCDN